MTNKLTQTVELREENVGINSGVVDGSQNTPPAFKSDFEKEIFIQEVRRIVYLILGQFPNDFKYQKQLVLDFGASSDSNNEEALQSFLEIHFPVYSNDDPHKVARKVVNIIRDHLEDF